MATPRKPKFYVLNTAAQEFDSDQELAVFVRLLAHWSERWRIERWDSERACRLDLTHGQLLAITGKRQLPSARKVLSLVTQKCATCEVTCDPKVTSLFWPKLPELQGWASLDRGRVEPESSDSASDSASAGEEEEEQHTTCAEPSARQRVVSTPWKPLLNLLKREPGTESEKASWLERDWPMLEAKAVEKHPKDRRRRSAALRALTLQFWRAQRSGRYAGDSGHLSFDQRAQQRIEQKAEELKQRRRERERAARERLQ